MIFINMAGITVRIDNKYKYIEQLCRDYIAEPSAEPDLDISVSEDDIDRELLSIPGYSRGYIEGICIYRSICRALPLKFNGFVLHSAIIEYEGRGYGFSAASGTGKTTHIRLWQKRFGEGVRIINGDKPIVRFVDGKFYAYGTPWCGKEGYNINTAVPLEALCFVERATENSIKPIGAADALMRIIKQTIIPTDLESVDSFFPLLDKMLTTVPSYVLGCNISEEAAEVAYRGMNN